jgi:sugar phosphate isomerase/epimerase
MKIGASHLASEDIPLEESLEIFEALNKIEYFEITHERPFREISDDKSTIDLINSYELKYTIHSAYTDLNIASFNKAIQKASINEIERSIDFAVDIDSDIVVIHPGIVSYTARNQVDFVYSLGRDSLIELKDYAKDRGVNPCIENLPAIQGFMYQDINLLNETLTELDMPMTLDIGHAHTAGFAPEEMYFDCVKHIHVHDNPGDEDSHLTLGEGSLAVNDFFDVFMSKGYDGIYMLELHSVDSIKKSLEYMKEFKVI